MSDNSSDACYYCKKSPEVFTIGCGHKFHLECMAQYIFRRNSDNEKCPICGKQISKLSLFQDIVRNAGMNESGEFYSKISNWEWSEIVGLGVYILENEGSPLEAILERTFLIFKGLKRMFPRDEKILEHALKTGDRRIISFMKAKQLSFNSDRLVTEHFLYEAWRKDLLELINDLVEIYNVSTSNIGLYPTLVAARTGNYEMMTRLVASGANIHIKLQGLRPITMVCQSDEIESTDEKIKFIEHFWKEGLRENYYKFDKKDSPFVSAIKKNDLKLVDFLLKYHVKTSEELIDISIECENLEMTKFLHEVGGINLNENHLKMACDKNLVEIVEYILIEKIVPQFHENTIDGCVLAAAGKGQFEIIKLLIDYGINKKRSNLIVDFDFTTIKEDIENKFTEILDYFLNLGADIDAKKFRRGTVLSKLCINDDYLPIIKKIVQYGANVDLKDPEPDDYDNYPILNACQYGCPEIFKFLINNGADSSVLDTDQMNCFLCALESENLEMIKIAFPFCNKNWTGLRGYNAFNLISAFKSESDAIEIFDYLVEMGVKMNIYSNAKKHPLFYKEFYETMPNLVIKYFEYNEKFNLNFHLDVSIKDLFNVEDDEWESDNEDDEEEVDGEISEDEDEINEEISEYEKEVDEEIFEDPEKFVLKLFKSAKKNWKNQIRK